MARVTSPPVMTSPSSAPLLSIHRAIRSDPKSRIRSSSSERKKIDWPGSPWRPERPRSWRSMRRDSCRSVPMIWRPGLLQREVEILAQFDVGAAAGHVGRDRDRAPSGPRPATISASRWWYFAFSTSCLSPRRLSMAGERLRDVHVHRADQDRPAELVQPLDLVHDRVVLLLPGLVDPVGLVDAGVTGRWVGMTLTSSP